MFEKYSNIITALVGQVLSLGLAAYALQWGQKTFQRFNEMERRLQRLENRDELRRELDLDKLIRPRSTPDKPQ